MNISVQLCGLINTIVLLIFYLSAKRLRSFKRNIFLIILILTIVNISFDIGSIIAIFFRNSLSITFVNIVCKLYLCIIDAETWVAILYMLVDTFHRKKHKMLISAMSLIMIIECFLVLKYPIHIYAEGNDVYTYGPSVTMLYFFAAANISVIWVTSFVFEDRIKKRRKYAVRLWILAWLIGMGVQAMNHALLVVGFATSLGIMVVYFMLENPEGYIDKQYACLNSLALEEYVEDAFFNRERFGLCEIEIDDDTGAKMGEVIEFMDSFKNLDIFKGLDKSILLVSKDRETLRRALDAFQSTYMNTEDERDCVLVILEDAERYNTLQEILRIIGYIKERRAEDGSGVIRIDDVTVAEIRRRDHVKGEINRALLEDRVEVFLQPIFSTQKKRFTSAEALVRIRNTDGSLLAPGLFIPVAEETGQIIELGKRILEKTCDFMATSQASDLGIDYIEVNLSVVQAEKLTLFDEIMSTVEKYKVKPAQINLEITESALIKNKEIIIENMKQLKKVGFTFSLDDFGKGESNLMYLVEMPFDILKLDMDMTKAFHVNDKAKSAVRTVRYMADDMKLKIVAEGIENKQELDAFMEYNIEYIQGYHFSKPLPMTEFIGFIKDYNEKNKIA